MRAMFTTVAPRYDFITRAFSYGMDRRWKRTGRRTRQSAPSTCACSISQPEPAISRSLVSQRISRRAIRRGGSHRAHAAAGRGAAYNKPSAAMPACCPSPMPPSTASSSATACEISPTSTCGERNRTRNPPRRAAGKPRFFPSRPTLCCRWLYLAYLYAQGAFWGLVLHGGRGLTPTSPIRCAALSRSTISRHCSGAPATGTWMRAAIFWAASACTGRPRTTVTNATAATVMKERFARRLPLHLHLRWPAAGATWFRRHNFYRAFPEASIDFR